MDLIKIGKYIAGKRKALGLTQKEYHLVFSISYNFTKWNFGSGFLLEGAIAAKLY